MNQPTDKVCETCKGDPAVCATVPGLRHCELANRPDQSGLIDGVQFEKNDPHTRMFIAANYWREMYVQLKAQHSASSALENARETVKAVRRFHFENNPPNTGLAAGFNAILAALDGAP